MEVRKLTCIECPMGCSIEVTMDGGKVVSVVGNSCPRGKMYAENEVVCPRRVLTSTVRSVDGKMISVKTDKPIKKAEMFDIMKVIAGVHPKTPVKIGDVLLANISEDANLVATDNVK